MATIKSTIELVDKMSSQLSTIESNINSMKSTLKSVSDEQSAIDGFSWDKFCKNAEAAGEKMVSVGKKMTVAITTPLVMLGKKLYGTATDYESAFAGVKKTTDATEAEYDALYGGLLQIAETNPTGFVEAAGIMEMAGQLGVAKEELIGFTEAYIGLQESTNINGEEGAADIARFLNVTEKSTANIDRVGGVIVGLGNNFATTEQEILAMATRMGATADLAGFSSAEILAFSAALSSVGINAEAGGSAAGKLMKKMQLAAEVGGTAQEKLTTAGYEFESGLDFLNALSSMKTSDKADMASTLGMTVEALQNLGDSWYLMEQFSDVMGVSGDEFLKGWDESAAQSMLKFFQGLGNLDPESGNSILAQLAEMDITEIRLSNLVAAMAGNSDLFQAALAEAYKQYGMDTGENALAEEVAKRYETQESQNAMLGNKLENSMADLGDNLVKMVQPALDKVNELLTAFNSLSETDQNAILTAFMVFAAGGPIVTAVGATVEVIGKIGTGILKAKTAISGWLGNGGLSALLTNPATWGVAAGGALLLFISYLDSIPTKFEVLAKGATEIPITIDDKAYQETLSKIQEVQNALNDLKPGEIRTEYENASAAVAYGFGTQDMFASALGYETAKANANINQVASDYAAKMTDAQNRIAEAAGRGDTAAANAAKQEYEGLRTALDGELTALRGVYTEKISDLFNGMASQYPEAASAMTDAIANYDLMRTIAESGSFDWDAWGGQNAESEAAYDAISKRLLSQAWDLGYITNKQGNETFESYWQDYSDGMISGSGFLIQEIRESVMENLNSELQTLSDNPILSTWLADMLSNPAITENMDVTQLSGALEGIFKALDYQNALKQAGDNPSDWGKYVSEGLGQGITDNASVATDAGTAMGDDTISNIKAALGVASPSVYMIEAGLNVADGLGMGINQGMPIAVAAADAMGNAVIVAVEGIMSPAAGNSIGANFSAGIASGIASGASAVVSAATAVAAAGLAAAKSTLGIASPSKETYWQGEMLIAGYVNSIHNGSKALNREIGNVLKSGEGTWNNGVWAMISSFANLEKQALADEFNNVEDGVKINESDIKKIRQLAEREVINHFTTAEVKVEMNNTNNINNDMDIDGIIDRLEEKVAEKLEAVAEGVYT